MYIYMGPVFDTPRSWSFRQAEKKAALVASDPAKATKLQEEIDEYSASYQTVLTEVLELVCLHIPPFLTPTSCCWNFTKLMWVSFQIPSYRMKRSHTENNIFRPASEVHCQSSMFYHVSQSRFSVICNLSVINCELSLDSSVVVLRTPSTWL